MMISNELRLLISFLLPFLLTYLSIPKIINKMNHAKIVGRDVNKLDRPEIPEMGGITIVLGFSLGSTLVVAFIKYFDSYESYTLLVSICILCIASLIGLMDDVSILGRKEKAWFISFASLPLLISQIGNSNIDFIIIEFNFTDWNLEVIYWILIVPFGITCCANALNMSAGYNGLESGQMAIISFNMLIISYMNNADESFLLILGSMFGSLTAFYLFNKYPAKIFMGDIGTLGFGSLIAAVAIMSNQIVFAIICILPSFFELYATIKYKFKGIERRNDCMNPNIDSYGKLSPPEGSDDYTLAYFILGKKSLTEKVLVNFILFLYLVSGFIAILISHYIQ